MSDAELTLKTTPPRIARAALARERLVRFRDDVQDRTALFVVAPAGFGKTTLLLQWRRRWLEQGACVAWLDADALDEPMRFARALRFALQAAGGRCAPATPDSEPARAIEALTALLADIALAGGDTVLMIDQAERLPAATLRASVPYLLLNAPANLRVVIGTREPLPLRNADLAARGQLATLAVDDLRLQPGESREIVERRLGARATPADVVHLQEIADGWPLGLQLALASIEHEPDLSVAARRLSARRGHLREWFVESLPAWLPAPALDFLVRVAMLEHMDAGLCGAVTGVDDAAAILDDLVRRTPIVSVDEDSAWYRLHPLARDFLLARLEALPAAERAGLHARASHGYEARDLWHEAAKHALAAGDEPRARTLAARALWGLGTQGRLAEAGDWLQRVPPEMLAHDVSLRLVAGWIDALGDRNAEALRDALAIADDPAVLPLLRMEATRVAGGAAVYADRVDLLPAMLAGWPQAVADGSDEPLYAVAPLNIRALLAMHAGNGALVRRLAGEIVGHGTTGTMRLASTFAQAMAGLSHIVDGDPLLAEERLRPLLAPAERADGRRGAVPALLAAVLALALQERDDPAGAEALLADRLDIVESSAPDVVLSAYRALIGAALARRDERRALTLLASLEAVGQRRGLARLRLHSLVERIRLHAAAGRVETVALLIRTLDRFMAAIPPDHDAPLVGLGCLAAAQARIHAALGRGDFEDAVKLLQRADYLVTRWKRGRDALTVKVLRAIVLHDRDGDADGAARLLAEAIGLAALGGVARLLPDTHPRAVALAAVLLPGEARATSTFEGGVLTVARPAPAPVARAGLLTSKEAEILALLGRGMSNKVIARALDVSAETVKWHLKNVFAKLGAGTRRHAVERAKLLGLVEP